jgi:hypothetical protein
MAPGPRESKLGREVTVSARQEAMDAPHFSDPALDRRLLALAILDLVRGIDYGDPTRGYPDLVERRRRVLASH